MSWVKVGPPDDTAANETLIYSKCFLIVLDATKSFQCQCKYMHDARTRIALPFGLWYNFIFSYLWRYFVVVAFGNNAYHGIDNDITYKQYGTLEFHSGIDIHISKTQWCTRRGFGFFPPISWHSVCQEFE